MTEPSNYWIGLGSSGLSTFIYSCALTPFDVIKNTQISSTKSTSPVFTGVNLIKNYGFRSLWRGFSAALLTQYSSNLVYYPLYEISRPKLESKIGILGPGFAAICCRLISVCITLPIERFRTGIQGTGHGRLTLTLHGLRATLYRDLIFSFTFFNIMENIFKAIKDDYPSIGRTISITVGAIVAGVITHPFDVIKTKVQTRYCCFSDFDNNTLKSLRSLQKDKGFYSIFIGIQPRMIKIVAGLILYINIYENIKILLNKINS